MRLLNCKLLFSAIVICLSLGLSGCEKGKNNETSLKKGPSETIVDIMVIKTKDLDNKITTTGSLLSDEEVDIQSEISGRVVAINFKEGIKVSKGMLLVKLYDKDLRAELKKSEVLEKQALSEEQRKKKLLGIKAVSEEEYEQALSKLESIRAEQDLIRANLEKTEIRAPFGGVIGLKQISSGSYVSPNTKIANIQKFDPIKIEFAVPERYAGMIHSGSTIGFSINDRKYSAKVYALDSRIDPMDRTLKVRAFCANPKREFIPGTFTKIEVMFDTIKDAILVPSQALVPDMSKQKVFVYRNGRAKSIEVKTGIRTQDEIEIIQGLNAGDTLITTGLMQVKNNRKVKISRSENKEK